MVNKRGKNGRRTGNTIRHKDAHNMPGTRYAFYLLKILHVLK